MKYTLGELSADSITGAINGTIFGLIFSFYTHPFEFNKPEIHSKFKGKSWRYYGSWSWRMGLAFGSLRVTYNAIIKEELGPAYELGGIGFATLVASKVLF